MYLYKLTNKRRIDCPHCGKHGKYSAYVNIKTGELAPPEYGMCSSCREYKIPPNNIVTTGEYVSDVDTEIGYFEADILMPATAMCFCKPENYHQNNFIDGLEQIFDKKDVQRVVDLYKLGRFHDSGIVFPYFLTDNHLCTGKIIFYDKNLHRIKEGKKQNPRFLHNLYYKTDRGIVVDFIDYETDDNGNDVPKNFKLKMCLFGHNQILNDKSKDICLVESEKSAVVMSIVAPEFIWVASGGKTLIQDYKFTFFGKRKCYVFPDLSSDDNVYNYWLEKLTLYNRKYGYNFEFVNFYTDFLKGDKELITNCKNEKLDVADFVLHFNDGGIYTDFLRRKLG